MTDTQSPVSSDDRAEGSNVPKVLARNSACHQCRKRKLKCDAIRPVCTNCTKPRPRATDISVCSWDEQRDLSSGRTRRKKDTGEDAVAKRARLNELEERVAAFEKQLQDQIAGGPNPTTGQPGDSSNGGIAPSGGIAERVDINPEQMHAWNNSLNTFPMINPTQSVLKDWTTPASMKTSTNPSPGVDVLGAVNHSINVEEANSTTSAAKGKGNVEESPMADVFDLVWPDWPQDLPTLEVIERVVGVFFDKVPTVSKMIHRATFLGSLQLPPSHSQFPARALLHAILAVTAPHLPATELAKRSYFPIGSSFGDIVHPEVDFETPTGAFRNFSSAFHATQESTGSAVTPIGRFQMWHRRKTFQNMAVEFDSGARLLQAVQAQIIVTTVDAYNAWWTDMWMESGACVRMAVPLRINESPNVPDDVLPRFKHVLIPNAQTPLEQASRDRTWWMAYVTERGGCMSTPWAESLADEEITVELPVLQSDYDRGTGELQGVQTLQSRDFFSSHPPRHCDGFVLYIKALKLWSETTKWFRRYCRGRHTVAGYLSDPNLRLFLSQINAFRLTFPAHLKRPTQRVMFGNSEPKSLDGDLIAAIMLSHAVTLALGEPLITKDMWDSDVAKMSLSAIRAILSLLYDITSTSYDLSLLPYSCPFTWFMCSRALCRFIDAADSNGDHTSSLVFRSELEVFRLAMIQHGERYPIANRQLKMIDELIQLQSETQGSDLDLNCTREQIFDPDYRPSVDPSRKGTGSISSSTPSVNTPNVNGGALGSNVRESVPSGKPAPREGLVQIGNPTKQYWKSTYPSAACERTEAENAGDFWVASRKIEHLSMVNGQEQGTDTFQHTRQQLAHNQYYQSSQTFGQTVTPMTENAVGGQATIVPDMNLDIESWFDISNYSFDVDALNNFANSVDPNATFNGPEFAMM